LDMWTPPLKRRSLRFILVPKQQKLLTWAQGIYIAGLALGLIFIIPSAWFPLQLGKITAISLCMSAAAVLFVLSGSAHHLLRKRTLILIGVGALLPLAYIFSYAYSLNKTVGMTGFSVETDTLLFVIAGFLVYSLGLGLFRTLSAARSLLGGLVVAGLVVGFFQYVAILFGTAVLPATFSDRSVNLVGKWNDLGLTIGFVAMLALLVLELGDLTKRSKIVVGVIGFLTLLLLTIIHFPLIWAFLLVFCVFLSLWSFIEKRGAQRRGIRQVPWLPVAGAVLFGMLLLWGSVVNTTLTDKVFPVSSLEVRPSFSSTVDIIKDSHGSSVKRFLVGTGPETFGDQWLLHKPVSVNQSPFWNLDFNIGFSSFMTALGTVGLVGALAWLAPLVLAFIAMAIGLRNAQSRREQLLVLTTGVSTLYFWSAIVFYVPSSVLVLIALALAGALFGLVFDHHTDEAYPHDHRLQIVALVLGGILAVGLVASTYTLARRAIVQSLTNQGLIALQQGRADDAISLAQRAQRVEVTADALRLGTDAGGVKITQLAQNAQNPKPQQIQEFALYASTTISLGQATVSKYPQDYRGYVSLGKIYDILAALQVKGAYENAQAAYAEAAKRNPTNPQIPLLIARLDATQNNIAGVQQYLSQALTLKPDYTDAILMVVQLDVAGNDIPSAIRAAQAAVQSAPGVPSIWFQLGLLHYASGDTASAVPVLEQAVKLQSDYANAKYFLGLSYAGQGRTQDAIVQFTDLQKSNPDNQEVQLILRNLLSGKPPFEGAQPPVTSKPQNRTEAPISQ
ncbi:MAG: Tfp pilus assembly protein PilF, partial [Patescibacteria group bacterium]|nr:Tfp pilus assembly protein PilF [Patescibacteria group bacterium]